MQIGGIAEKAAMREVSSGAPGFGHVVSAQKFGSERNISSGQKDFKESKGVPSSANSLANAVQIRGGKRTASANNPNQLTSNRLLGTPNGAL